MLFYNGFKEICQYRLKIWYTVSKQIQIAISLTKGCFYEESIDNCRFRL